ncbi:MAG: hypothetical protein M0R49_10905 [Limnochordia bacterium]|nr:hypothetical protein [Limnochordia bacterium]
MSQTNAMDLVEKLYGTTRREGLEKYSIQHPRDVVDYCFLNLQKDNIRIIRLLNVAILHDVVEDYVQDGYTVERVQSMVGLGPNETRLLDLITRKEGQEYAYLPNLFAMEDGAIVKLADRIANLKDLQKWVEKEQGFTERSLDIFKKWRYETLEMLDLTIVHYREQMQDPDHPISRQVQLLQEVFGELEKLYVAHHGNS